MKINGGNTFKLVSIFRVLFVKFIVTNKPLNWHKVINEAAINNSPTWKQEFKVLKNCVTQREFVTCHLINCEIYQTIFSPRKKDLRFSHNLDFRLPEFVIGEIFCKFAILKRLSQIIRLFYDFLQRIELKLNFINFLI